MLHKIEPIFPHNRQNSLDDDKKWMLTARPKAQILRLWWETETGATGSDPRNTLNEIPASSSISKMKITATHRLRVVVF